MLDNRLVSLCFAKGMSKLKKAFEGICQRHLTDYRKEVSVYLPVKDLVGLTQEYLVDELNFETELMILSIRSRQERRLSRLVINSKNPLIQNWLWIVKKCIQQSIPNEEMDGFALESFFKTSLLWANHESRKCNRVWCWYHYNYLSFQQNFMPPETDCGCGKPLNFSFPFETIEFKELVE